MAIDAAQASFGSMDSLYDYDLVLWDPHRSLQPYLERGWGAGAYNGLPLLSERQSPRLRRDLARRTNDFDEFLKLGRTLVVFLPGDLRVYIDSGERTHSGTGRNRQTTNIVKPLNIMEALPTRPARAAALGDAMEPAHSSIGPLYRQTSDYWCYASVFDEAEELRPLLRVTGTAKLAAAQTEHQDGTIILLPILLTGTPDEDDQEEDDYEYGEEGQSEDVEAGGATAAPAETVADAPSNDQLDSETVDKMVFDWLTAFTSSEEVVWPDWADEYRFKSEADRAQEIAQRQADIAKLQAEVDMLNSEQETDQRWKLLVVGTGTPFEEAVATALTQLGFDLRPTVPGRTDIRGSRGNTSVVVETKGVRKSAAESHCAQLEKWVAEDLEVGRKSKGILIINAYLGDPPLERTQLAFPDQMRRYAEMRNHCLASGLQLLNLARTALAEPERTGELADLLVNTTGVIEGWDDPAAVFSETPAPPRRRARKRTSTGAEPSGDQKDG
ncbi:hypothetical protein [Mycolicibacter sinensis]|uniref:Uncharacterized protein n=1 Tax=Mycolicibacter sinensis (strain JDM601) TaxID=875328 RepID=A0A1A3U6V3_MYCSD|nr:hypothetical protein [Mycolicibacter sinensis]OBK90564.1 hypothetical protein A5648_16960 [Mycolicibacter sinensis]